MALLKTLIAVMSVLIVAGIVAVVWRIAQMGDAGPRGGYTVNLDLAPDCAILGATTGDGMVTVTIGGGQDCSEVYVIDMANGDIVARISQSNLETSNDGR